MRSQDLSDEEIVRLGVEIYERKLKTRLEPALNGREIAIAVEDGDFEVAATIAEADQKLRSRHTDAVFFYGRVGGDHAVKWSSGYPRVIQGKH